MCVKNGSESEQQAHGAIVQQTAEALNRFFVVI
jgi:hypothetical protein